MTTRDPKRAVDTALNTVRRAVAQGVIDAANEIRRQAIKKTPVDTGNLRKSAEIFLDGNVNQSPVATPHTRIISVRYSAPYAAHVHNASGRGRGRPRPKPHRGKYWDPIGSEPQFLAKAADAVSPRIRGYIKRRVDEVMRHGY